MSRLGSTLAALFVIASLANAQPPKPPAPKPPATPTKPPVTASSAPAPKKEEPKKTEEKKSAYFEIGPGKDGKFRFNLRNADGDLLGMSGPSGFKTREEALKAIEEIKSVVGAAKTVDKKDDK